MSETPRTIHRSDYQVPSHHIDRVDLRFELGQERTRVHCVLNMRTNGASAEPPGTLRLDGDSLTLISLALDGRELSSDEYQIEADGLRLRNLPTAFELSSVVEIDPDTNTSLEGLYRTTGTYCTQCEAEGFRRITYFLDRPDVMARFTTTIVADRSAVPILLSNGNRVEHGPVEDDPSRHFVRWEDPFPKPAYLFALVAGDLHCKRGSFCTMSGREVTLEIWVEAQNLDKCEHALASLKRAMTWDEVTFGREYDLDLYMIVAVNDFNMGAMENKGLNVFNSKYVLARPETATDSDYEAIEAVIGHEYFHNWTGNRVTCRDWFQLTLKEGLTVFRDEQFTADMTSPAVKRIEDVKVLRAVQFAEDRGPMAHPIRPESYIEMNNFYTVTVYNKGAEVIRMLHTLLGAHGFRRGMDLYFDRHDGSAVTCDDFRIAMADANGVDLDLFEQWYLQEGTPVLEAAGDYDPVSRCYTLTLHQRGADSLGHQAYNVRPIPVRMGLIGADGAAMTLSLRDRPQPSAHAFPDTPTECILELRETEHVYVFEDIEAAPIPSLLRDFSAPVELRLQQSPEDLEILMAHDSDPFNRWESGQRFATTILLALIDDLRHGRTLHLNQAFSDAWGKVLSAPDLDGSLRALAITLPNARTIGQAMETVAVDEIHAARSFLIRELAAKHRERLVALHLADTGHRYEVGATAISRRSIGNAALAYLCHDGAPDGLSLAKSQFESADNMTHCEAALRCLVDHPGADSAQALAQFYDRWAPDPLVIDKWFSIQAASDAPDVVDRVLALSRHRDFNLDNPNRLRSLVGPFTQRNQFGFHAKDGRGYSFLADTVIALDSRNPQVAARMVAGFNSWRRYDGDRQQQQRGHLSRILAKDNLSNDVFEIASKALKDPKK